MKKVIIIGTMNYRETGVTELHYPKMENEYRDLLDRYTMDFITSMFTDNRIRNISFIDSMMYNGYLRGQPNDWKVKVLCDIRQLDRSRKLKKIKSRI